MFNHHWLIKNYPNIYLHISMKCAMSLLLQIWFNHSMDPGVVFLSKAQEVRAPVDNRHIWVQRNPETLRY